MTHLRLLPGGGTGRNVREEKKGDRMDSVEQRLERLLDQYESRNLSPVQRQEIERKIAFLLQLQESNQ